MKRKYQNNYYPAHVVTLTLMFVYIYQIFFVQSYSTYPGKNSLEDTMQSTVLSNEGENCFL